MANYAANHTTRVKFKIIGPAGDHDLLIRMGTITDPTTIGANAVTFGAVLGPVISNSATIDSAQYALAGSNAFTPLTFSAISGSNGVTYTPGSQAAGYFSAPVFKSAAGSRFIIYVYYADPLYNQACRFAYADLPAAWNALAVVLENGQYTAIDRGVITRYGHVDVGINDSVTSRQRR